MQAALSLPLKTGLILLAHGSRDPLWRKPIEAVQQAVQLAQPRMPCLCAYLDACAPDLEAAAQMLLRQEVTHITVLPLFLGTGKHAREDIPRLLALLGQQHPDCEFQLEAPAGENPRITAVLAELAIQAAMGTNYADKE